MHNPRLPAALLLLGLLPDPAAACSCIQPKPYADRRLEYHSVFHGEVIAAGGDEGSQLRWIRFEVIKDYSVKGSGADTLTVWTSGSGAACGVDYPVGAEVLVFADTGSYLPAKPAGALLSGLCFGNASGAGLEPALRAMEDALGVRPGGSRPGLRRGSTRVDCGQVLFEGKVQANGVLRSDGESR